MNYISRCFLLLSMFFAFNVFGTKIEGSVPTAYPSTKMDSCEKEYILLVGNPGCGKSTLINALKKSEVAPSGISAGRGLTTILCEYYDGNKVYIDTPGLSDTHLRQQAAREIEEALKKQGIYRIIFVVTLEAGRVRPDDITTINTVMSAIKIERKCFNVIINKVNRLEKSKILSDTLKQALIYQDINGGEHKTNKIYYIDYNRDMEDELISILPLPAELEEFMHNKSDSIYIPRETIETVESSTFDEQKRILEEQTAALNKKIAEDKEFKDKLIQQMDAMKDALKRAQDKADQAEERARNASNSNSSSKDEGCNLL